MVGSRVYHHTPLTPVIESSPWIVMVYATPDARRAVAGIFRTSEQGDPTYLFRPRGLDMGRSYKVTWSNRSSRRRSPVNGWLEMALRCGSMPISLRSCCYSRANEEKDARGWYNLFAKRCVMRKSDTDGKISASQRVELYIKKAIYSGALRPRERIIEDDREARNV